MKKKIIIAAVALMVAVLGVPAGINAATKTEKRSKKLIVIDAGHQGRGNSSREPIGPGAKTKKAKVATGTYGKWSKMAESQLNLKVAKKLATELKKRGYKVKMIRTSQKVNISNAQRAKMANKWKADAFIRIHANGSTSSRIHGALTMAPANNNPYMKKSNVTKSKKLSRCIIKSFCKATKAKNQGVLGYNTMSGINWCKVPVTILEMGYMTNKSEDLKMASASYQKKMVTGVANGMDSYFGIK